jgi:hypothetical protein
LILQLWLSPPITTYSCCITDPTIQIDKPCGSAGGRLAKRKRDWLLGGRPQHQCTMESGQVESGLGHQAGQPVREVQACRMMAWCRLERFF